MRQRLNMAILATATAVALNACGGGGAEAPAPAAGTPATIVFSPAELTDSSWLDEVAAAQRGTADAIEAFHDFRFTDRQPESGIAWRHRIVDDAGRTYRSLGERPGELAQGARENGGLGLIAAEQNLRSRLRRRSIHGSTL
jgi:hypothetical protein